MAGMLLLDRILADAAAVGAVVRLLGDPYQLAAVEAGGALRLIARASGVVELDRLHRFRTAGEADASLLLRDGDNNGAAFTWYREGRIVAGSYDAMCDAVFDAWAKDCGKGLNALMTAAGTVTVAALNRRAQAWYIAVGDVDTRRVVALRARQQAHVGDVIVTRLNRRRMTLRGGRDFVKSDGTWTIQALISSGGVVVRHTSMFLTAMYFALQS